MNVRIAIALATAHCIALTACSSFEEGITVDVVLRSSGDAQKQRVTNDLGYAVDLTRAYLAVGSVEIERCAGSSASALDLGWFFTIGRAHAHTATTATRLGVPGVLSLGTGDDETLDVGAITPPEGRYCMVKVMGIPADEDAVGLPDDVPFVGQVLHVDGTYSLGEGPAVPFVVESALEFEVERSVTPFTLESNGTREATLTVMFGAPLFDGIDFAAAGAEGIAQGVLRNVQDAASISVQ